MIGNGLGPGGRGKDEVVLRRLRVYTQINSPKMATNIDEIILSRS
jgi:hypothetical protein